MTDNQVFVVVVERSVAWFPFSGVMYMYGVWDKATESPGRGGVVVVVPRAKRGRHGLTYEPMVTEVGGGWGEGAGKKASSYMYTHTHGIFFFFVLTKD